MKRPLLVFLVSALTLLVPLAAFAANVYISEYVEGTSNNKGLEIFNNTDDALDLGGHGYKILLYMDGASTPTYTIPLTGVLASRDVLVITHSSAGSTLLARADVTSSSLLFTGDDAVVLVAGEANTVVDAIGQVGVDPGTEWGLNLTSTADNTLRRKADVCDADVDPSDAFDPAIQWDGYAQNTYDGVGTYTTSCQVVPVIGSTWGSIKTLYR